MTVRLKQTAALMALLGAAFTGSVATAQEGPGSDRRSMLFEMFDGIDLNADGKLSQEELVSHRTAMFVAADANADGALDQKELAARQLARFSERLEDRTARMIETRDDNGDGMLQPAEMEEGRIERLFARIDTDNDGAISKAEAEDAAERFRHRRKDRGGWMGMRD